MDREMEESHEYYSMGYMDGFAKGRGETTRVQPKNTHVAVAAIMGLGIGTLIVGVVKCAVWFSTKMDKF